MPTLFFAILNCIQTESSDSQTPTSYLIDYTGYFEWSK